MAIFTREKKQYQIDLWQTALEKVASGQEYTIGTRRLRRADLNEIRETLEWLDAQPTVEDEMAGRAAPFHRPTIPQRFGGGY